MSMRKKPLPKARLVFAGNRTQFDMWYERLRIRAKIEGNYRYMNQVENLARYTAQGVEELIFVGNWWEHPLLKSDYYIKTFLPRMREANVTETVI